MCQIRRKLKKSLMENFIFCALLLLKYNLFFCYTVCIPPFLQKNFRLYIYIFSYFLAVTLVWCGQGLPYLSVNRLKPMKEDSP